MSISSNLIVVIQNEPRDGDIVYIEKDLEAYRNRVVRLDMVEADVADEIVELGTNVLRRRQRLYHHRL